MYKYIGLSNEIFINNEENFETIKNNTFNVITPEEFSALIDMDDFVENEGWEPQDIFIQDPDVVFYEGKINNKKILGINHSGYDNIYTLNGEQLNNEDLRLFEYKKYQPIEHQELSWLLLPPNSVSSYPKTGHEEIIFENEKLNIFESEKGRRYQLKIKNDIIASAQIIDCTIDNIYTSQNYRKKGYSKQLIEIIQKDYPLLQHSDIQTDLGEKYSKNTGLPKRQKP